MTDKESGHFTEFMFALKQISRHPPVTTSSEYEGFVSEVMSLSEDKEPFIEALEIWLTRKHNFNSTGNVLPEEEDRFDSVCNALLTCASERGASDFEVKSIQIKTEPTQQDKQFLFDLMREDGFDGLTYKEVGRLMGEFRLEW